MRCGPMRYEKFIRLEQKKRVFKIKNSSGINYDKNNNNDNNGNNDKDKINNNIKILAKLMILITSIFLKINQVLLSSIL